MPFCVWRNNVSCLLLSFLLICGGSAPGDFKIHMHTVPTKCTITVSTNIFYCQDYFGILHSGPAEYLERLTTNAKAATVLSSVPISSDTTELEGRQMNPPKIQLLSSVVDSWHFGVGPDPRIRNTELRILFRILLFRQWLSWCQQKIGFCKFFYLLLLRYIYICFQG